MATYNLNLTTNHCSDWGFWEAVRELFQNGDDQERKEPNNLFTIEYNEKQKKLILSNKESILERNTILMGKTTKADDPDSTGKYGEGYKVALAVLTRLGKKVVINNFKKNEKWTPISIVDKAYDGEKVIKLKIEKYIWRKTPDNNLTWTIHDVSKEEWDSIQSKYLKFNTIGNTFLSEKNTLLLDEKFKGCIFVNGLFVEKVKTELEFGYSFHPSTIPLDRDRKTVEGFDLYWNTSHILTNYASESKENAMFIMDLIKRGTPDVQYIKASAFAPKSIVKEFQSSFLADNGEDAFPVSSQEELEHVQEISKSIKPIIVTDKEKSFIAKDSDYNCVEKFAQKFTTGEELQVQTPEQMLKTFLIQHGESLPYEAGKDLKKIIERSKSWMVIPDEIEDDITSVIDESAIYIAETNDSESKDPSSIVDNDLFLSDDDGFDDGIPF